MKASAVFDVRDRFRKRMLWLATALAAGCCYAVLDYGFNAKPDSLTHACLWAIMTLLSLIAANTRTAYRFLFSCAFWVTVEFLFYIVLKALAVTDEIDPGPMQMALATSMLFLAGYLVGQWLWPMRPALRLSPQEAQALPRASSRLYWWLLLSFVGFKLLYWVMLLVVGGGDTALEVSQATQNQGAAYLFKIPALAQASYFLFLLFAYKHGQFQRTALAMTLWIFLEAVLGAGRYLLVTTILINVLLCHLYVRPVRLIYLVLLAPLLVFVVTFFGYVRDIELASASVYMSALNTFVEERELMFKLFMGRLDMLPQMAEALRLDGAHQLKHEGGLSYVYSLLHAVPRNLWPDKPPLTAAYVTDLVNPAVFADGVNIYPSIMLEGYMNFLWPGALMIGVVVARLSAWYDRALLRGSLRAQAFALLTFSFPMGLINEGIHSNIFASLIYLFAIYALWLVATRAIVGHQCAARLVLP